MEITISSSKLELHVTKIGITDRLESFDVQFMSSSFEKYSVTDVCDEHVNYLDVIDIR